MRLDVVPETIPERVVQLLNLAPTPMVHTHLALLLARSVMEAARAGVFECLDARPRTADDIAERCRLHPAATLRLLGALATSGYLQYELTGASRRFSLSPMARKWLLPSSPVSLHDKLLFTFYEEQWIGRLGDFLRTGRDVTGDGHLGGPGDTEMWRLYQRAMHSVASTAASEVGRRAPVPKGARAMLDAGGGHGLFSVAICRRHPALSATIIDLPEAIAHAADLLAAEGMGDRVTHQAGDLRQCELGTARYDYIFVGSLLHHFDAATNLALMKRFALALRPGGRVTVQEFIRKDTPAKGGQVAALLDLYFALTSTSGTWSASEIAGWQRAAGLTVRKPVPLRTLPGVEQLSAGHGGGPPVEAAVHRR